MDKPNGTVTIAEEKHDDRGGLGLSYKKDLTLNAKIDDLETAKLIEDEPRKPRDPYLDPSSN